LELNTIDTNYRNLIIYKSVLKLFKIDQRSSKRLKRSCDTKASFWLVHL